MNTILILDVVVKFFDNSHKRMTMLTSFDPKIKPKLGGKDMLSFFLQEYSQKDEYKGTNIYEKVLGKNFTNYIANKVNELLIANGYQGKYTQLTFLAIKELNKINDMVIAEVPFEIPTGKVEETAENSTEEKKEEPTE
jgi:hypothetical protein